MIYLRRNIISIRKWLLSLQEIIIIYREINFVYLNNTIIGSLQVDNFYRKRKSAERLRVIKILLVKKVSHIRFFKIPRQIVTTMAETKSRNWSGLDCNLLAEIASSIEIWEDFVCFAGVCTSWRSEAADLQNNFRYKSLAYVSSKSIIH